MQVNLLIALLIYLSIPCFYDKNASNLTNKKYDNSLKRKETKKIQTNASPTIGILTQPSPYVEYPKEQYSHIASAYIKGIEAGGGHVIAIKYDDSRTNIDKILNGVNGILLPGGGANIKETNLTTGKRQYTQYGQTARYLIEFAKKENKLGRYFPVWGTCLGFELMIMVYSGRKSVIKKVYGMVNNVDRLTFINVKLFFSMNFFLGKRV